MAIQIIDNFSLNTNKPIDSRFVVGGGNFYATRNDIPLDRRYSGLRIWDLSDSAPYVWDGSDWINENTLGISGSGTVNRVAKFTPSGTQIGDSQIFDNGTNVGIGTITPSSKLTVNGNVSANVFIGDGSQLNSLNANNITSGNLTFNRLPSGGSSGLLLGFNNWVNPNTLSVNNATTATTATTANNVNISNNSSNNNQYVLFSDGTGNRQIRTNNNNSIRINPSNGNVGIGGNSQPSYRLHVNGAASIGSTIAPPSNGLRVQGETILNGLQVNGSSDINSNNRNIFISGHGGINTNGPHIDFDKTTTTGIFNPRFFRQTNTSGFKAVTLHRGNGSQDIDIQLGVGGEDIYFQRNGGEEEVIIRFFNLPTSPSGLGSNTLYRDGNDLKIT